MKIKPLYFFCFFIFFLSHLMVVHRVEAGTANYNFRVPSRGKINYYVTIPKNVDLLKAVVSKQTNFVNLDIYAPGKSKPSCSNSAWSSRHYKDPFSCYASKPKPGKWRIEVEGSVHISKVDRIKYVTGLLTVSVKGGQAHVTGPPQGRPTGKEKIGQREQNQNQQRPSSGIIGTPKSVGEWIVKPNFSVSSIASLNTAKWSQISGHERISEFSGKSC